jgi:hypothetical protein
MATTPILDRYKQGIDAPIERPAKHLDFSL